MNDPEWIHACHKADVLEVSKAVIELLWGIGVPLEYRHARLQLADTGQLALLGAVFPVDRVAAMVDGSPLIPVCLHEKAGAVNAPAIIGSRADIRPAKALLHGSDQLIHIKHDAHLPSEKWGDGYSPPPSSVVSSLVSVSSGALSFSSL